VLERLRGLLFGGPKNLLDPRIHHTLALMPELKELPELAPDGPAAIMLAEAYAGPGICTSA
jgi:hypothetical protein